MEDFSQRNLIIIFSSESIEIPMPNTYQELFNIFINKFKIEENSQKLFNITYHDEEDEIYISSEEDYQLFISQLKENNINNKITGIILKDSRGMKDLRELKASHKDSFNEKFNDLQKALLGNENEESKDEDNLYNKFSFNSLIESKNSLQEIIDRKEKEKEFEEKEKEYKTKLELKEKENKMNCDKFKLEIEKLKEEKEKLEKKINEYDKKSKEQDMDIKNYKNQAELKEKEYKSIIDDFNLKIKMLTEEKLEKDKIIDNYNKESKEKEEKYKNIDELNNKNIIEIEKYNDEIKALKEANQNLESKLDIYKKNALEQESKEKEYNSKIESYLSQIKILKEEKLKKNKDTENKINDNNINLFKENKQIIKKIEKDNKLPNNQEQGNNNFNFSLINIDKSNNQLIESTLAHQSEEYKNTLNEIKTKYKNELNKKCKEIIKNKDDIYSNIYNEINQQSQIIINKYLKKLEEFENNRRNELFDMIFKNSPPLSEIIHEGVKCERCSATPIIGDRYQCSKCPNYNLCERCEEENSIDRMHDHYFIRIRNSKNIKKGKKKSSKKYKNINAIDDGDDDDIDDGINEDEIINEKINKTLDNRNRNRIKINNITSEFKHEVERPKNESIFSKLVNNNNDNNNNINNNINNDNDDNQEEKYSVSFENLKEFYIINTGTKSYDISISIKNNCNLQYPKGVKLVLNEKESYLYPNEKIINIKPLKPNESQEIKLTFSNLKHLSAEAYSTFLSFLINDEIFDFIEIKFQLKQKRNKY